MKKNIWLIIIIFGLFQYLPAQNLKFAWLSDLHVGNPTSNEDLRLSVEDLNNNNGINFVIISGDITETGKTLDFFFTKSLLSKLNKPYYIIPGNHDTKWSESGGERFGNIFGNDRFHFIKNGFNFIGLHQGPILRMADGNFAPEDLRWLKSKMKKINKHTPIIFITHYPIDSSISNWFEFIDIIKNHDVKAILVGHGHRNMKMNFEGINGIMGRSNLSGSKTPAGYNVVYLCKDSMFFYEKKIGEVNEEKWLGISLKKVSENETKYPRPQYTSNIDYPGVKIKWIFDSKYTVTAEPVLSTEGILAAARDALYLLNVSNGGVKWKFKSSGAFYAAPAVMDRYVIVTSTDGFVYCLNLKSGKTVWKFNTGNPVVSVPAISDNSVYFGAAGKFYAFNIEDGTMLWEFSMPDGFVESKPAIYGDKIIFGAWNTYLFCLDRRNGNLLWKWSNEKPSILYSPAVCYPVIAKEKVFVVAPDRFLSVIDLESGRSLLRSKNNYVREAIGHSEDSATIFTKSMYDSAFAYRIDGDTLLPEWKNDLKFGYDFAPSFPSEKNGTVYFGVKNGYVFALDRKSGELKWKYRVSESLINNVLPMDENSVIVSSINGKFYYLQNSNP